MKSNFVKGRQFTKSLMVFSVASALSTMVNAQELRLHYNLEDITSGKVIDCSGSGLDGELKGSASLTTFDNANVVDLGSSSGYVDMGEECGNLISTLTDFTIHTRLYIPSATSISGNGNFVWTFSNAENIASNPIGNMFFSAKDSRYAITKTNYGAESDISRNSALTKGEWVLVTVTQKGSQTKLFINGDIARTATISLTPSELGATKYNWLGRPCYASDNYLRNAKISLFSIYDGALSDAEVAELAGLKADEAALKYNIDFSNLTDNTAGISGSLHNGASLTEEAGIPVLSLGYDNGYFDMGEELGDIISSLDNFTISTNLFIPTDYSLGGNGNFIYTFANSANSLSDRNGYLFMGANTTRYAISLTDYNAEQYLNAGQMFEQGKWKNITFTSSNGSAKTYIDGELVSSKNISLKPSDLGSTAFNFLGRSSYSSDSYLKGARYNDFRIYDGALSADSVAGLCAGLKILNIEIYRAQLEEAASALDIPSELRGNITLPSLFNGITVEWTSSDDTVLNNKGIISRPAAGAKEQSVTLTGIFTKDGISVTKTYDIIIAPSLSDTEAVAFDLENISLSNKDIFTSLYLPYTSTEGSVITWRSASPDYLTDNGKVVKLSEPGSGTKEVEMIATATKGNAKETRVFTVTVGEDEGYSCYLFAYFTGNSSSQEQIRFALSMDGYNYTPLNNGNPVISSDTIAIKNSVRDPHILRGEDGCFYMVVTDMMSSQGWSSNDGLVLLKSDDLVNWTHKSIDFPDTWPERFDRDNLTQVWAPQTIFDPEEGKYMVYYSIGEKNSSHYKIYYSYANEDFTELTLPEVLYDHGANTIDADIVYKDGLYHMFYKTEGEGNGIQKSTCETLRGDWKAQGRYLQQTSVAVEGSGIFKLINSDEWILMYDCYGSGYYQFCRSTDLDNFEWICNTATSGSFTPRHGTTITITKEEAQRLYDKWPSTAISNTPLGSRAMEVRRDFVNINTSDRTIFLPVGQGTDLTSFDPQLYTFGDLAIVSPEGKQDFSDGAIEYTFRLGNTSSVYKVTAAINSNPAIAGFYADPEILYSEKTNRFYIYPTSDGYSGWGGYTFNVFSSPDMVNWTDEGSVLDLSTDQVSWATGNAWAPCIEEKMIDGHYKYFFYFSGNAGASKQIGVAVADNPTGPFYDHGAPIITDSPVGNGQQIDVDVFTDPVGGKSYIYWGNAYMAGAELNEDMVSLNESTVTVMTPQGGTLSDHAYREAPYVFYRKGKYYFMWSVDDTGSDNYHVAYGTSDSPLGPIKVADEPVVLIQDQANSIYGTGHNSVVQIPGRDEWYIVYHRINKNYLYNSPAIHREICIDKMEFDNEGNIIRVKPTNEGISPVSFDTVIDTSVEEILKDELNKGEILRTEYYSVDGVLLGSSVSENTSGIYIRKIYYSTGAVTSEKVIR